MGADTIIRLYKKSDKNEVLKLLRLNTPRYFAPEEEAEFDEYLEKELEIYFVCETSGQLLGSAGINFGFENNKVARLSWDLVHPDWQGRGIGSMLLKARMAEINELRYIEKVVVRTSHLVSPFYAKHGFHLDYVKENYWASGIHLHHMSKLR